MNEVRIFENSEFGKVRVVEVNGEPWFVASDIAKALGYRMASDRHAELMMRTKDTQKCVPLAESKIYPS